MLDVISVLTVVKQKNLIAKIKYSEWVSITDEFSLERINTIQYASKKTAAWKKHAQFTTSEQYICSVDVALINGKLHKINGIFRKSLWETEELTKPATLIIRVHCIDEKFYLALTDSMYPISLKNKSQEFILSCYKK